MWAVGKEARRSKGPLPLKPYVAFGSRDADRTHRLPAERQSSKSIRQTAAARRQRSRSIPARRGRRLTLPVRRCTNAVSSLSGSRQQIAWRAASHRPPTHRCARPWPSPAPQRAPRHVERFDRTARTRYRRLLSVRRGDRHGWHREFTSDDSPRIEVVFASRVAE